jgi:hypothetical protein
MWNAAFEAYCYNDPKDLELRLTEIAESIRAKNPQDERLVRLAEVIED